MKILFSVLPTVLNTIYASTKCSNTTVTPDGERELSNEQLESTYIFGRPDNLQHGRNLAELFTTEDTSRCVTECIEEYKYFCPTTTYGNSGTCCDSLTCPRADFCSFNVPDGSMGLKLWSCPFDKQVCGPVGRLTADPYKNRGGREVD
jgi:hypothetical protein